MIAQVGEESFKDSQDRAPRYLQEVQKETLFSDLWENWLAISPLCWTLFPLEPKSGNLMECTSS
eukprot:9949899-Karenia_brevis.AAC.1